MEKIDNEYLERELNNNHEVHEIFKYQRNEDLDSLQDKIKESKKNELLLQININNIMPFYKHRSSFEHDSEEEEKFWEHVISILFISQLNEQYSIDQYYDIELLHNLEFEKKVMTRGELEEYKQYESAIFDRNDVIETIRKYKLENPRLHIVIKYFNNEHVSKELVNYLEDDLPFITMIYSDGDVFRFKTEDREINDMDYPSDLYSYKIFDKNEEGIESNRLSIKNNNSVLKYEKKI